MAQGMIQVLVLCNLIVTTIGISLKFETASTTTRPVQLSTCVLLLSSFFCFVISKFGPSTRVREVIIGQKDHIYTNFELEQGRSQARSQARKWATICLPQNHSGAASVILVACIAVRVVLFRSILTGVQCSWDSVEIFLPFGLCLYEYITNKTASPTNSRDDPTPRSAGLNSLKYVLWVAVWAASAMSSVSYTARKSTYICPWTDNMRITIPILQCMGLLLDVVIINTVSKISQDEYTQRGSWMSLTIIFGISAGALAALASAFLWKNPDQIDLSLQLGRDVSLKLFFAGLLYSNFIISATYLIHNLRPSMIFLIISCIYMYTYQSSIAPYKLQDLSGSTTRLLFISACVLTFGSVAFVLRVEAAVTGSQRHLHLEKRSLRLLAVIWIVLALRSSVSTLMTFPNSKKWPNHPIDLLINRAVSIKTHDTPQANLGDSQAQAERRSLSQAVSNYQEKYGMPPPPNFDKWHKFAIDRKSALIDDFDQIYNDLLPFWGIAPHDIRRMTAHMVERPWTEVVGVRITDGATSISPHIQESHKWMAEAAADMINKFSEWLPNMDLGFNINDESRVAIPWKDLEELKSKAAIARKAVNMTSDLLRTTFSPQTGETWRGNFLEPEPPYGWDVPNEYFEEASLVSSFKQFGSIGCPPDSLARTETWWNKKRFCRECPSPHSLSIFVQDWTLSGSVCHQPDIANLHGIHISPSAFKTTNKPFPIFSQSKLSTYNDILYPSPWNYWDKVVHDDKKEMLFSQKENTLFWRGATSEGFGIRGAWQGAQRQRFVHLINYTPNSSTVDLIVPSNNHFIQEAIPVSDIRAATLIDVSFVGAPIRCFSPDCEAQIREFNWGDPVDFQTHWKYKYLFDSDGAGFSGRFLPFLQSHSLVFRGAAFRQWFDDRLVAWKHFVPVDGRLHDLWGLVAYFGGTGPNGENAHQAEAEKIAEDGKRWADKVLRKEDMEIYMFRLLLEWARVVDDRRGELGFVVPPEPPSEGVGK